MFKYVNRLIHSLLSISINAANRAYEYYKYYESNE
jgi:hypothetical protein